MTAEPLDPAEVHIRIGAASDASRLLALFDQAVEWLVAQGRDGQWGAEHSSAQPQQVEAVRKSAASGAFRVAEIRAGVIGAMWLGNAPQFMPPAGEPELYFDAFVVDRRYAGHGIGAALLDHARTEAVQQGASVLRLICWAGGDLALVRYYQRHGFQLAQQVTLLFPSLARTWDAQILTQRI